MSTTITRGGSAEETSYLPVSTAFDVLADERRRHVLYYLLEEAGGVATADEIADHLVGIEPATVADDRQSVVADLHHRHLPKLEASGLVAREDDSGAVDYRGDPLVEECLGRVAVRDFQRL